MRRALSHPSLKMNLQRRNEERRKEVLKDIVAEPAGNATVESNPHTTLYTQLMKHPRLKWLTRISPVSGRLKLFTMLGSNRAEMFSV